MTPTKPLHDSRRHTKPRRLRALGLVLVAAGVLGAGLPAAAATISGLGVALAGANSADTFQNTGNTRWANASAVAVQASSATSFSTRYRMGIGTETSGASTPSLTTSHTASYTITFQVNAKAGEAWQLLIATSRLGALTLVDDGVRAADASLGAVTGTRSGAGSLASGSLGVAAVPTLSGNAGGNTPFSQSSAAVILGVGTGAAQSVTLAFNWTATARSALTSGDGDEAAVRMGIDSALGSFTADDYPGVGGRTLANDGHFVSVVLTPEPGTSALLVLGLFGLTLCGRRRGARESTIAGRA